MPSVHLMPVAFVSDVPRAARFYEETLGLSPRPGIGIAPEAFWAELDCGSATLALHYLEELPPAEGRVELDFRVPAEELDALFARVNDAGADIVDAVKDIGFGRMFSFRDPDGTLVRVSEQPD